MSKYFHYLIITTDDKCVANGNSWILCSLFCAKSITTTLLLQNNTYSCPSEIIFPLFDPCHQSHQKCVLCFLLALVHLRNTGKERVRMDQLLWMQVIYLPHTLYFIDGNKDFNAYSSITIKILSLGSWVA